MSALRPCILFVLVACSPASVPSLGKTVKGDATWYEATGAGACGYSESPQDLQVAALNTADYAQSAACGTCVKVKGPSGDTVVRVVDLCPGCGAHHIDLSREAFERISPLSAGRVEVSWSFAACEVSGPIRYHFKDGSSQWWTAIQVRNSRLPIESLEVRRAGAWVKVNRSSYNYFVMEDGAGSGDVHVRVSASGGAQLEDDLGPARSDVEVVGQRQFP